MKTNKNGTVDSPTAHGFTVKNGILAFIVTLLPTLAFAIDPPASVWGTATAPGTIKWEWTKASGAARYDVIINNRFVTQTSDTHYTSSNLPAGEHTLVVKSISSNWDYSGPSKQSQRTVSGGQSQPSTSGKSSLHAPRDPRGSEVRPGVFKWEWARVDGATKYEVSVNDRFAAVTSDLYLYQHDLGNGEHSMYVKAIDSENRYSDKSSTAYGRMQNASTNSTGNDGAPSAGGGSSVPAPGNVRGTEVRPGIVKWEWDYVGGASEYEVIVNGSVAGRSKIDHFRMNLSVGEHYMTVRSVDPNGRTSGDSTTARVYVEGTAQDQQQPNNQAQAAAPTSGGAAPPPADDNGMIDPQSWSQPGIGKDGYKLVFSDEFNYDRLNQNRWNTQLRWDGSYNGERYEYRTINKEEQFYVNPFSEDQEHLDKIVPVHNPFEFNGSRLAIRAIVNPKKKRNDKNGYGPLDRMFEQATFLSGAITTYDKFSTKYGRFEARIKIPHHVGTFPAFWLHHQKREWEGTQKTEIDIMENLGHSTAEVYNSFHYWTGVKEGVSGKHHHVTPQPYGWIYTGTDYSKDYHVYAVEWEPGYIKFLIDDEKVSELWHGAVDHEELYILLNLAVGGAWTNYPSNAGGLGRDSDNFFPTDNDVNNWSNPALEIDYVRVYKRN